MSKLVSVMKTLRKPIDPRIDQKLIICTDFLKNSVIWLGQPPPPFPFPSYRTANIIGTLEDNLLEIWTYLEYSKAAKKPSNWLKCKHTLRFCKKESYIGKSWYAPDPLIFIGKHRDNFSDWLSPILETINKTLSLAMSAKIDKRVSKYSF